LELFGDTPIETREPWLETNAIKSMAQVCRRIFLGVPPNLKLLKKVSKNSYIFNIFVSFLHLGVPPNLFSKLVCRKLKKVENHCHRQSKTLKLFDDKRMMLQTTVLNENPSLNYNYCYCKSLPGVPCGLFKNAK
jgi:hypothetical protein